MGRTIHKPGVVQRESVPLVDTKFSNHSTLTSANRLPENDYTKEAFQEGNSGHPMTEVSGNNGPEK